jgi:hypothetical protein
VASVKRTMYERRVRIERGRGDEWHCRQKWNSLHSLLMLNADCVGGVVQCRRARLSHLRIPQQQKVTGVPYTGASRHRSVEALALRERHTKVSRAEIQPIHALHVAPVVVTTGQQERRLADDFGQWHQGKASSSFMPYMLDVLFWLHPEGRP